MENDEQFFESLFQEELMCGELHYEASKKPVMVEVEDDHQNLLAEDDMQALLLNLQSEEPEKICSKEVVREISQDEDSPRPRKRRRDDHQDDKDSKRYDTIPDFDVVLGVNHNPTTGKRIWDLVRRPYAKRSIKTSKIQELKTDLRCKLEQTLGFSLPRDPIFWYSATNTKKLNPDSEERRVLKSGSKGIFGVATDDAIKQDVRNAPKKDRTRTTNVFNLKGSPEEVLMQAEVELKAWVGKDLIKELVATGFREDLDRLTNLLNEYNTKKIQCEQKAQAEAEPAIKKVHMYEAQIHEIRSKKLSERFAVLANQSANDMVECYYLLMKEPTESILKTDSGSDGDNGGGASGDGYGRDTSFGSRDSPSEGGTDTGSESPRSSGSSGGFSSHDGSYTSTSCPTEDLSTGTSWGSLNTFESQNGRSSEGDSTATTSPLTDYFSNSNDNHNDTKYDDEDDEDDSEDDNDPDENRESALLPERTHRTIADLVAENSYQAESNSIRCDSETAITRSKQQRLLLLWHASRCQHEAGKCPVSPHCSTIKNVLEHVTHCTSLECTEQYCLSSRSVLSHYQRCKDIECSVCRPLRVAKQERKDGEKSPHTKIAKSREASSCSIPQAVPREISRRSTLEDGSISSLESQDCLVIPSTTQGCIDRVSNATILASSSETFDDNKSSIKIDATLSCVGELGEQNKKTTNEAALHASSYSEGISGAPEHEKRRDLVPSVFRRSKNPLSCQSAQPRFGGSSDDSPNTPEELKIENDVLHENNVPDAFADKELDPCTDNMAFTEDYKQSHQQLFRSVLVSLMISAFLLVHAMIGSYWTWGAWDISRTARLLGAPSKSQRRYLRRAFGDQFLPQDDSIFFSSLGAAPGMDSAAFAASGQNSASDNVQSEESRFVATSGSRASLSTEHSSATSVSSNSRFEALLDPVPSTGTGSSSRATTSPSSAPSGSPSVSPSTQLSSTPSSAPGAGPFDVPSVVPSDAPSTVPSDVPSTVPSDSPSVAPSTVIGEEGGMPTGLPSGEPTIEIDGDGSGGTPRGDLSTSEPLNANGDGGATPRGDLPTTSPTVVIGEEGGTSVPLDGPSAAPSDVPSAVPSDEPSQVPSDVPPTASPSAGPTTRPTPWPTTGPSLAPNSIRSASPSAQTSNDPDSVPRAGPRDDYTETFIDSVELLPSQTTWGDRSDSEKTVCRSFYGDFGTHYARVAKFGGSHGNLTGTSDMSFLLLSASDFEQTLGAWWAMFERQVLPGYFDKAEDNPPLICSDYGSCPQANISQRSPESNAVGMDARRGGFDKELIEPEKDVYVNESTSSVEVAHSYAPSSLQIAPVVEDHLLRQPFEFPDNGKWQSELFPSGTQAYRRVASQGVPSNTPSSSPTHNFGAHSAAPLAPEEIDASVCKWDKLSLFQTDSDMCPLDDAGVPLDERATERLFVPLLGWDKLSLFQTDMCPWQDAGLTVSGSGSGSSFMRLLGWNDPALLQAENDMCPWEHDDRTLTAKAAAEDLSFVPKLGQETPLQASKSSSAWEGSTQSLVASSAVSFSFQTFGWSSLSTLCIFFLL